MSVLPNMLTVLLERPVHIFRDLLNVKTVPGEDAELSCEITKPEVSIHWLKNGHLIRQSHKYKMSVEKNLARLIVKNTTIRDSGEYCCQADGVSSHAKLEVRGKYLRKILFWNIDIFLQKDSVKNTTKISCQSCHGISNSTAMASYLTTVEGYRIPGIATLSIHTQFLKCVSFQICSTHSRGS